ncbi:MAG: transporter [Verrucomicrobiota bacterium]
MRKSSNKIVSFAAFALSSICAHAQPPLVTGDVPTAEPGHFEWSLGSIYQKSGGLERQLPASEFVYGLNERSELSLETPYLNADGERGFGDITLGTKVVLLPENPGRPGLSGSYEWKLNNGSVTRGLGSGGHEHGFLLRSQKTFGWFTPIVNLGYTIVPDVQISGVRETRRNTWKASCAQEWRVSEKTAFLTELYWQQADRAHEQDRLAWNAGVRYRIHEDLELRFAAGKSVRSESAGGPDLRVYVGVQWAFAAPWSNKSKL